MSTFYAVLEKDAGPGLIIEADTLRETPRLVTFIHHGEQVAEMLQADVVRIVPCAVRAEAEQVVRSGFADAPAP